jgi:hypothetical protein
VGAEAVDTAAPVVPGHWRRSFEQKLSGCLVSERYSGKTALPRFPPFNPFTHVFTGDENGAWWLSGKGHGEVIEFKRSE